MSLTEDVQDVLNLYSNIVGNTTRVVKTGPGILKAIVGNLLQGASVVNVYDNTAGSGTLIATIQSANTTPVSLNYNVAFTTGLTIVTTGSNNTNLTIVYQ